MICCDICDEWFHAACFNLNLLEIVDIENFPFQCPECQAKIKKIKKNPKIPQPAVAQASAPEEK